MQKLLSLLSITLFIFLWGCNFCDNRILKEISSPDKTKKLVLFERDCGATTAFSYQLSILDNNDNISDGSIGNVFIGDDNELKFEWMTNNQVAIAFKKDTHIYKKEQTKKGVGFSYSIYKPAAEQLPTSPLAEPFIEEFPIEKEYEGKLFVPDNHTHYEMEGIIESGEWLGIFYNKGNISAKTTSLNIQALENNEFYDWHISTEIADSCLVLIQPFDSWAGDLLFVPIAEHQKKILPNDSLSFYYGLTHYTFYATAINTKDEGIKNYELFLKSVDQKTNKSSVQRLVAQPWFDDTLTEVLLVTDINRDGIPDFLLNTSHKYSYKRLTLYLSHMDNGIFEHSVYGMRRIVTE